MDLKVDQILNNEKGIALLLVLWIVILLSVLCAELSWTMRTETSIAGNYKEGLQAYYTAEAGINRALLELIKTMNSTSRLKKSDDEEDEEDISWEPGGGPYCCKFGEGKYEVRIEDEGNKLNLNAFIAKKNILVLKRLLTEKIGIEGEQRDIVADSLIDWRDTNHNITGINGAEEDYYKSLDSPYECRDGKIPVVDELLLVRGVTEEIYYGQTGRPEQKTKLTRQELNAILSGYSEDDGEEIEEDEEDSTQSAEHLNVGLGNIFSIFSGSKTYPAKLDMNTASLEQLLMLEGIDTGTARDILKA